MFGSDKVLLSPFEQKIQLFSDFQDLPTSGKSLEENSKVWVFRIRGSYPPENEQEQFC